MTWLRSTRGRLILLAALLALVIAGNAVRATQKPRGVEVEAHTVRPTALTVDVRAPGIVEPTDPVELRAPLTGRLVELAVEPGDQVRAGDVVARYDAEDLRVQAQRLQQDLAQARAHLAQLEARRARTPALSESQLEQAELKLRQARLELERVSYQLPPGDPGRKQAEARVAEAQAALTELRLRLESETVSDEELAAARVAVAAAAAGLRQVQSQLVDVELRAPAGGTVLEVRAEAGGAVTAGMLLVRIARLDVVDVLAEVDEIDIGGVAPGLQASVTSLAYPERSFAGQVARVAPVARREGDVAVFDVRLRVDNEETLLRPGMTVRVRIESERREGVLTVPYAALTVRDGRTGVFVIEGDRVRFRPVETGLSTETEVVVGDLSAGDVVVAGPPAVLRVLSDGDRVRLRAGPEADQDGRDGS